MRKIYSISHSQEVWTISQMRLGIPRLLVMLLSYHRPRRFELISQFGMKLNVEIAESAKRIEKIVDLAKEVSPHLFHQLVAYLYHRET